MTKFLIAALLPFLKQMLSQIDHKEIIKKEIPSGIGAKMKSELLAGAIWFFLGCVLAGVAIFSISRLLLFVEFATVEMTASPAIPVLIYSFLTLAVIAGGLAVIYRLNSEDKEAPQKSEPELEPEEDFNFGQIAHRFIEGFNKGLEHQPKRFPERVSPHLQRLEAPPNVTPLYREEKWN